MRGETYFSLLQARGADAETILKEAAYLYANAEDAITREVCEHILVYMLREGKA